VSKTLQPAGGTHFLTQNKTKRHRRDHRLAYGGAASSGVPVGITLQEIPSAVGAIQIRSPEHIFWIANECRPAGVLAVQVDYAKVLINGKTYWMPRTVRAEQTQTTSKNPVTGQYVAEYSHYQKFNVSVKINCPNKKSKAHSSN
jgi:hypothetical protein